MTPTKRLAETFGFCPPRRPTVLAIDPGSAQSGWVLFDGEKILELGLTPNLEMLANMRLIAASQASHSEGKAGHLAIEMIASYGMPVGREVFETCVWIGRFIEAWGGPHTLVYRREVKLHLTDSPRSKDPNVSQALRDRFGWTRSDARKLGLKSDIWQALGVACTYWDTMRKE